MFKSLHFGRQGFLYNNYRVFGVCTFGVGILAHAALKMTPKTVSRWGERSPWIRHWCKPILGEKQ